MSRELQQGENYVEEEGTPDVPENPIKRILSDKDKVKFIAIGGVVGVVLIVGLTLYFSGKGKESDSSTEINIEEWDNFEDTIVDNPIEDDVYVDLGEDVDTDDTYVSDGADMDYTPSVSYSDEELQELRSYGYTADEIEFSSMFGLSYSSLVETAKEDIRKKQEEAIKELGDTGSEAYKQLMEMTFLVGSPITVDDPSLADLSTTTLTYNVDYVKCEARGNQLWVRLELEEPLSYCFMQVTPARYAKLKDHGNMVVNITTSMYNGTPIVVSAEEVITASSDKDYGSGSVGTNNNYENNYDDNYVDNDYDGDGIPDYVYD